MSFILLTVRRELNKYNLTPSQKRECLLFVARKHITFDPQFQIEGNVFWVFKPIKGSPWGEPWKHCFIPGQDVKRPISME